MNVLKEYFGRNVRQYGILAALVVIVLLFQSLTGGSLLAPDNVASLVTQNAYVIILAIGMVAVIVAGHIDLSVGSVVAFIGGLTAIMLAHWDWPVWAAVLGALVVGALVGMWQGFWIAYVGIPAFIVTLAGMLVFRGLAILLVGETVNNLPKGFNAIGGGSLPNVLGFAGGKLDVVTLLIGAVAIVGLVVSQLRTRAGLVRHELSVEAFPVFVGKIVVISALIGLVAYWLSQSRGGTPIILLILGVLVLGFSFLLNRTVFGRHVYAIGGNRNAAILSGVDARRTDFMIFVNMGVLAAVAAVATTARAGAGVGAAGANFELDAIAACFIGGTAVSGGVGRISGAIVGALIMGVLNKGLSIQSVEPAWQQVIKGLVLLAAVALDIVSKRRNALR